jgi:hypothetical protein
MESHATAVEEGQTAGICKPGDELLIPLRHESSRPDVTKKAERGKQEITETCAVFPIRALRSYVSYKYQGNAHL